MARQKKTQWDKNRARVAAAKQRALNEIKALSNAGYTITDQLRKNVESIDISRRYTREQASRATLTLNINRIRSQVKRASGKIVEFKQLREDIPTYGVKAAPKQIKIMPGENEFVKVSTEILRDYKKALDLNITTDQLTTYMTLYMRELLGFKGGEAKAKEFFSKNSFEDIEKKVAAKQAAGEYDELALNQVISLAYETGKLSKQSSKAVEEINYRKGRETMQTYANVTNNGHRMLVDVLFKDPRYKAWQRKQQKLAEQRYDKWSSPTYLYEQADNEEFYNKSNDLEKAYMNVIREAQKPFPDKSEMIRLAEELFKFL